MEVGCKLGIFFSHIALPLQSFLLFLVHSRWWWSEPFLNLVSLKLFQAIVTDLPTPQTALFITLPSWSMMLQTLRVAFRTSLYWSLLGSMLFKNCSKKGWGKSLYYIRFMCTVQIPQTFGYCLVCIYEW